MQKLKSKILIKKHLLYCFFVILFFSLIVGFRGSTRDTQAYFNVFKNIESLDLMNPALFYFQTGMEIGFGWYSYLISLLSNSSFFLFGIYSFLTFYFIYKICEKLNIKFRYTLLLYLSSAYFVLQQFMQIRQGLATPIGLYALVLLYKEERFSLKFLLLSLFAVSMHQISSIPILVGSIIYFFRNKIDKISLIKFKILSFLLVVIVIFLCKYVLINVLIELSGRIAAYSETEEYGQSIGLFRLPNIKAFFTFSMLLILITKDFYKNKIFVLFYLFFALSFAFRVGFIDLAILSGRFAIAFSYAEIFILPFIFFRFKKPIGILLLLLFVFIQAVATYGFQVPPEFYESYFYPLY